MSTDLVIMSYYNNACEIQYGVTLKSLGVQMYFKKKYGGLLAC